MIRVRIGQCDSPVHGALVPRMAPRTRATQRAGAAGARPPGRCGRRAPQGHCEGEPFRCITGTCGSVHRRGTAAGALMSPRTRTATAGRISTAGPGVWSLTRSASSRTGAAPGPRAGAADTESHRPRSMMRAVCDRWGWEAGGPSAGIVGLRCREPGRLERTGCGRGAVVRLASFLAGRRTRPDATSRRGLRSGVLVLCRQSPRASRGSVGFTRQVLRPSHP